MWAVLFHSKTYQHEGAVLWEEVSDQCKDCLEHSCAPCCLSSSEEKSSQGISESLCVWYELYTTKPCCCNTCQKQASNQQSLCSNGHHLDTRGLYAYFIDVYGYRQQQGATEYSWMSYQSQNVLWLIGYENHSTPFTIWLPMF